MWRSLHVKSHVGDYHGTEPHIPVPNGPVLLDRCLKVPEDSVRGFLSSLALASPLPISPRLSNLSTCWEWPSPSRTSMRSRASRFSMSSSPARLISPGTSSPRMTLRSSPAASPGSSFPNVSKWYECVSSHLATSFPGKAAGVSFGGEASPSEEPQKEAAAADDDDLDLFGEETEEEKKAAEEREASKKSSYKKKESGKSSVLMGVKPWDDETDVKKLEEAVRSVQMEGLLWGASKLVPVGYGIKKLQIMLTIVDDLVSVDNLIEEHLLVEPANGHIQSCDIIAFNKI